MDVEKPYIYLQDLKSKFGTLMAATRPIVLFPKMLVSVQVRSLPHTRISLQGWPNRVDNGST